MSGSEYTSSQGHASSVSSGRDKSAGKPSVVARGFLFSGDADGVPAGGQDLKMEMHTSNHRSPGVPTEDHFIDERSDDASFKLELISGSSSSDGWQSQTEDSE